MASCKTTSIAVWLHFCYLIAVALERDKKIRKLVAERVRGLRAKQPRGKQTQAWLAHKLGEDKSGVIRLEQKKRPITLVLIERLADAFGMPAIEFLAGGNEAIWRGQDEEARLSAIRQVAIDHAEMERERLLQTFGQRYVETMSWEMAQLAARLNGAAQRLDTLIVSEGSIALEREINWQRGWLRDLANKRQDVANKRQKEDDK